MLLRGSSSRSARGSTPNRSSNRSRGQGSTSRGASSSSSKSKHETPIPTGPRAMHDSSNTYRANHGRRNFKKNNYSNYEQARHLPRPIPRTLSSRRGPRMLQSDYRGVKTERWLTEEVEEETLEVVGWEASRSDSQSLQQSPSQILSRRQQHHKHRRILLRLNLQQAHRHLDHRTPLHTIHSSQTPP